VPINKIPMWNVIAEITTYGGFSKNNRWHKNIFIYNKRVYKNPGIVVNCVNSEYRSEKENKTASS